MFELVLGWVLSWCDVLTLGVTLYYYILYYILYIHIHIYYILYITIISYYILYYTLPLFLSYLSSFLLSYSLFSSSDLSSVSPLLFSSSDLFSSPFPFLLLLPSLFPLILIYLPLQSSPHSFPIFSSLLPYNPFPIIFSHLLLLPSSSSLPSFPSSSSSSSYSSHSFYTCRELVILIYIHSRN